MRHSLFLFFLFLSLVFHTAKGQKLWGFEECVQYALNNNINVNKSKISKDLAKNTVIQNATNMFTPNINFNASQNFNFGNSINPLTYEYSKENSFSGAFNLAMDYSIFEGLSRMFEWKASKSEKVASNYELLKLENDTRLTIANYYLSVLLAKENIKIAKEQLSLSKAQFEYTKNLVEAGLLAIGDQYEVEAQVANNELNLVNAEVNVEVSLNNLKWVLQLSNSEIFDIQEINADYYDLQNFTLSLTELTNTALNILPNMQAPKNRYKAAEQRLKSAKGRLSPMLSISSNLSTNNFNLAKQQVGSKTLTVPIGKVGVTNEVVYSTYNEPILEQKPFGKQLLDNFTQAISLNLRVPIFSKWQRITAINNAKLQVKNADLDIKNQELFLSQDIQTAYTNLKSAAKKYEASFTNLEASEIAFQFAKEKYKANLINSYEFDTVKNRYVSSQASLIQSKFEYIFYRMIVGFYQTGVLELN